MDTRDTTRQRPNPRQPAEAKRRAAQPRRPAQQPVQQPVMMQNQVQQPVMMQNPGQQPAAMQRQPQQAAKGAPRPVAQKPVAPAKRRAAQPRKRTQRPRKPDIEKEIVYTPAPAFNRNRLLLHLGVIAAVVLAMVLSLSLFFKVKVDHKDPGAKKAVTTITVSGNQKYSAEAIIDASGIQNGDSLLSINSASISGKIITGLPYVKSVRVGIKLPDTVNIEIEELDIVYAIADGDTDQDDQWWLITSGGKLVERTNASGASAHTKLLGVTVTGGESGMQAVALEDTPDTTIPDDIGEETVPQPVTISAADMLDVALTILQYLEQNDILGQMVSVDVSDISDIEMWYGNRFLIRLGDSSELSYKVSLAVAAVGQLKDHDRGTLDVSFYNRPEVVYTPQAD